MKMTLKVASVLTWINLIFWGLITGRLLLETLASMYLPALVIVVMVSAIPLNCYAALKLHKSIRHPNIPLSSQTPAGIRFIGFIALFYGLNVIGAGIAIIQNAKEVLDFLKDYYTKEAPEVAQMPAFKSMAAADMRGAGVVILILGICLAVNVILNLRLLRWYLLLRKTDAS